MEILSKTVDGVLYIFLDGEIDEHSVKSARRTTDELIYNSSYLNAVVFDLKKIRFMDSTGIGFLIGRYKVITQSKMKAYIVNPNITADKILSMSGVYSLIPKYKGVNV